MRGGKAAAGLREHGEDLALVALGDGAPVAQRAAIGELHREVDLLAERADLVDDDDVRVMDLGHRLRLAEQAGLRVEAGARRLGGEQLDRDLAIEVRIVRGVHDAHAPAPSTPSTTNRPI